MNCSFQAVGPGKHFNISGGFADCPNSVIQERQLKSDCRGSHLTKIYVHFDYVSQ